MSPSDANDEPRARETVLIVEDDLSLRDGLAMNLRLNHYDVLTAASGETGMKLAFDARPDLIVLDIMLPDWSGLDILAALRKRGKSVPVLMLSARRSTNDKVGSLKLGADDYLTKPFDLPELLARIEALLRRRRTTVTEAPDLVVGSLVIAPGARRVTVGGKPVKLSAREFDLLCLLASSPGRVFSREDILDHVWGLDYEGTSRTVDNFIVNLRRKLKMAGGGPVCIRTVPTVGYVMSVTQDSREL